MSKVKEITNEQVYKFFRPNECIHKRNPQYTRFVCILCNKSIIDYPNISAGVPVDFTTFDGMKWLLKELLRMDSDYHFELRGHPDYNYARILKTTASGTELVGESPKTKVHDTLPVAVFEAIKEMIRRTGDAQK